MREFRERRSWKKLATKVPDRKPPVEGWEIWILKLGSEAAKFDGGLALAEIDAREGKCLTRSRGKFLAPITE
jgi:hypothetical protein